MIEPTFMNNSIAKKNNQRQNFPTSLFISDSESHFLSNFEFAHLLHICFEKFEINKSAVAYLGGVVLPRTQVQCTCTACNMCVHAFQITQW